MPLFGGFRIGRWLGFPIRIDYSWFLVAALVVWTFSFSEFPLRLPGYSRSTYLAMGSAAAILFFLSVLLHELGHAVVARKRGITIEGITLFIFGGIAQATQEARRPLDEFLLTAAGPLTSLLLAGVFYGAEALARFGGVPDPLVTVFGFLGLLNLVLAIFNMIPGFPLDGGRIFRSAVWAITGDMRRATRWATWGGRLFGMSLIALGLYGLSLGLLLPALWAVFIGWFVAHAASTSFKQFELRRALERIPVSQVMSLEARSVPANTPINEVVEDYFLRGRREAYAVELDGIVLGLLHIEDVAEVPLRMRDKATAAQVMRPTYDLPTAHPHESLADVAIRLGSGENSTALVVEGGRAIGLVDVRDVGHWAARVQRLGLGSEEQAPAEEIIYPRAVEESA
ncbi:MAG: site-2 protease family protein [Gemmatimonadota bacterium]|nr:site-2 protease family protein [Gemmatimonadota bacterium]